MSLGRTVALKTILHASASPADLARFRSEAESAAGLDHPAIVPIYEVGDEQGRPYFTMKYVAGTTLARRLADGPLPPREAAALLLPICRAIQFAHERGILHRDLKPSNILIDEAGHPHVSDFGLAKRVEAEEHLTLSGAVLGTPSYMAPEQARRGRGQLGAASDVYSLGTILYQMLTGRPPFQAATPVETVLLVLEQEPLPPRLLNPRADRELEMIALKCLQKPPELRYPSAAALADDLAAYLADEPTAARSGLFSQIVARAFRETHHATVLENWGLLWMWHSLALLITCLLTNLLQWRGTTSPLPYLVLWIVGLGTWAGTFWTLRRRSGPVTFVERQIAHVWASSMISIALLFVVEIILGMPVLTLSPVLALTSGMIFLIKAGTLSGRFYLQAAALFATALGMAALERMQIPLGVTLFGVVSAACFFFPGLKYYRQRASRGNDAHSDDGCLSLRQFVVDRALACLLIELQFQGRFAARLQFDQRHGFSRRELELVHEPLETGHRPRVAGRQVRGHDLPLRFGRRLFGGQHRQTRPRRGVAIDQRVKLPAQPCIRRRTPVSCSSNPLTDRSCSSWAAMARRASASSPAATACAARLPPLGVGRLRRARLFQQPLAGDRPCHGGRRRGQQIFHLPHRVVQHPLRVLEAIDERIQIGREDIGRPLQNSHDDFLLQARDLVQSGSHYTCAACVGLSRRSVAFSFGSGQLTAETPSTAAAICATSSSAREAGAGELGKVDHRCQLADPGQRGHQIGVRLAANAHQPRHVLRPSLLTLLPPLDRFARSRIATRGK